METDDLAKTQKALFRILQWVVAFTLPIIFSVCMMIILVKPYNFDLLSYFFIPKGIPADHPYLTPTEEKIFQNMGIDPADLPTDLTPGQRKCADQILGAKRVTEILNGGTLKLIEIYQIKDCFK